MLEEIKNFVSTFFDKLCVQINNIEVLQREENTYSLKINTEDSLLLIWNYGVVFELIQELFRKVFRNKFGKSIRIQLEINDYIHNRDAKFFAFIDEEITKVRKTGRNIKLPLLNWYERKKVHSYITNLNDTEIITESRWEKKERSLFIVLLKNKINKNIDYKKETKKTISKLEIDIDWNDI